MKADDSNLIGRCLSNEAPGAWEEFVTLYSKLIWRSIHKIFMRYQFQYNQEDTEDLFHTVFLSLIEDDFRKLRQFQGENNCSLSTWLSVVTVRLAIDFMRRDKSRFHLETAELEGEDRLWEMLPDSMRPTDATLEDRQLLNQVRSFLDSMSPRDKLLGNLLFIRGYTSEEAAEVLGLPVASVYSRKNRIAEKIRKYIDQL